MRLKDAYGLSNSVDPDQTAQEQSDLGLHYLHKYICPCLSQLQSTLVISKSQGPTKTLRDIRTSTYQICGIEEKTIRTTKFHNDYVM